MKSPKIFIQISLTIINVFGLPTIVDSIYHCHRLYNFCGNNNNYKINRHYGICSIRLGRSLSFEDTICTIKIMKVVKRVEESSKRKQEAKYFHCNNF